MRKEIIVHGEDGNIKLILGIGAGNSVRLNFLYINKRCQNNKKFGNFFFSLSI